MNASAPTADQAAVEQLRNAVAGGADWPTALLEAMALWTTPEETYRGRRYNYFVAGEAFDWLILAERLCCAVEGLVTESEEEHLLFTGRFPPSFDRSTFRRLLGVEKYRGYLNFYYGVTVEESLQLATELEVMKRSASNSIRYRNDFSDEAFARIYGDTGGVLLNRFREEASPPDGRGISMAESKGFTYWLFKYRLQVGDKARIASDTRKGLEQLKRMREAARRRAAAPPSRARS